MEEAEKQFVKAVELEPKSVNLRLHLGDFYLFWGKKEKALDTYQKRSIRIRRHIPSRVKIAEVYLNDKQFDKASEVVKKILEIQPQEP